MDARYLRRISICPLFKNSFRTLQDLLALVDLANLLVKQRIAARANVQDLLALSQPSRHRLEDLVRDLSSSLVLGERIGVGEAVV